MAGLAPGPTLGSNPVLHMLAEIVVIGTSLSGVVVGLYHTQLRALILTLLHDAFDPMGIGELSQIIVNGAVTIIAAPCGRDRRKTALKNS